MQIQEGKRYVGGDGQLYGPMKFFTKPEARLDDGETPEDLINYRDLDTFIDEFGSGRVWCADGKWAYCVSKADRGSYIEGPDLVRVAEG